MDVVPKPRVIVVFNHTGLERYSLDVFRRSGCLVHECVIPDTPPPTFMDRLLMRKSPLAPIIEDAYEYVLKNYRAGDSVMILDSMFIRRGERPVGQPNRHAAIRQLAVALDRGYLHKSRSQVSGERIPIKCVFFHSDKVENKKPLEWSGVNQLLAQVPFTAESVLYCNLGEDNEFTGYAIERGQYGQIKRKESWGGSWLGYYLGDWVVHQTSHIIQHRPNDFWSRNPNLGRSMSTLTYTNCTKRRGGLPSDGAIPTGGQLIRVTQIDGSSLNDMGKGIVIWSSQSFREGEYDAACSTPRFGPKPL